jgi:hypothetical protein
VPPALSVAIFDALHRRGTVSEAMLYAFDLLELDGEDLRGLPLGDRKKRLARLVGKRRIGIVLSTHTAEDGATIFQQACKMGRSLRHLRWRWCGGLRRSLVGSLDRRRPLRLRLGVGRCRLLPAVEKIAEVEVVAIGWIGAKPVSSLP